MPRPPHRLNSVPPQPPDPGLRPRPRCSVFSAPRGQETIPSTPGAGSGEPGLVPRGRRCPGLRTEGERCREPPPSGCKRLCRCHAQAVTPGLWPDWGSQPHVGVFVRQRSRHPETEETTSPGARCWGTSCQEVRAAAHGRCGLGARAAQACPGQEASRRPALQPGEGTGDFLGARVSPVSPAPSAGLPEHAASVSPAPGL